MKKNYLILILAILISFVCGYCIKSISFNQKEDINVFGTYVQDLSTISINHDLTYRYTSPFTSGQMVKIDEKTYRLVEGDFNEFILIFSNNSVKIIDTKNMTSKEFSKFSYTETELRDER